MNEDGQLIDQTLAGQSAAFGALVRKYQDRLYNTLVHVTGNPQDAEDVVQEAFVQAFVKLDSFKRSSAFYTWLYRIALNLAVSRWRRNRPTASVDQARETTGMEPTDNQQGPQQQLEVKEQQQQVWQALDRLGDDYRQILVLREIEGCCYDTIAEILEMPIGTVRSRLHRARLELREQLKEVSIND